MIERQDLATRLSVDLARADLKMKPAEYLILWALTPFAFVFIAFIAGFIFPGFQNIVALAVFFLLGLYAPRWYQKRQMKAGILREDGTFVHDPDGHITDEFRTIPSAALADGVADRPTADGQQPSGVASGASASDDEPVR